MPSARGVLVRAILRPGRTFAALALDPKRLRKGLRAMIGLGLLYAATSAFLGAGGALVTAPALVPLSPENYYFFQMIFALPLFLASWLLASTVGRLLARPLGGRGSWKTTAAGLSFAFVLPCLLTWLPQTAFGGLLLAGMPQAEFMDLLAEPGWLQSAGWAYHALAVLWMVYLASASLRAGHGLSRIKALFGGLIVSAVFLASALVLIR
jgi:hypothetical protein